MSCMREIGKPETIARMRASEWSASVACLLAHSNRYGWAVRAHGWTGPVVAQMTTMDDAEKYVEAWVAENPDARCGFVST